MYSSWYKNDQEPSEEDDAFLHQKPSHRGTIWFISLAIVTFALVGLAVFLPDPGLWIAILGFPVAAILFSVWFLRLLGF
ncbi:MAG: hypothetical protein WHV66_04965 [Anaerolineales bacterium]